MIELTRLPAHAGVGFKPQHFSAAIAAPNNGAVRFVEIHAENYMGEGGAPQAMLRALHEKHALSVHGVALSLGGPEPLDRDHLHRLKILCERHAPDAVSEHLAWSTHEGAYFNDLLPLPYTAETLRHVCAHVDQTQEVLKRRILLENPSTYISFADSTFAEPDFLAEIARRTGCGLLLDINNVFVSTTNRAESAAEWLAAIPLAAVGQIHLAGHARQQDENGAPLLIDDHGSAVADPVWALYAEFIARSGPLPTLIEWDNDVPEWSVLAGEAARAEAIMEARARRASMETAA